MPYVSVLDHHIEYQWFHPETQALDPPIVLLHEGLGCVALWKDFPQRLATTTGHAVCAYSRYGYGRSEALLEPRTVNYMHDEALQALPHLRERLGIGEAILFGHSDGASIALIHAGAARWPVRALVLLAPHVFVEEMGLRSIRQTREDYLTGDLKRRLARRHTDPDSAFWGWNDIWLDPKFAHWNIESFIGGIQCPVLVIQGHEDPYGSMAQVHCIVRAADRVEVCKLADCGHAPHREHAQTVLARVRAFLSRDSHGGVP